MWVHEIWAHEMWVHEMWAHEMWAHEMWVHEMWVHEMWAHEMWAHEMWLHEMWAHVTSLLIVKKLKTQLMYSSNTNINMIVHVRYELYGQGRQVGVWRGVVTLEGRGLTTLIFENFCIMLCKYTKGLIALFGYFSKKQIGSPRTMFSRLG